MLAVASPGPLRCAVAIWRARAARSSDRGPPRAGRFNRRRLPPLAHAPPPPSLPFARVEENLGLLSNDEVLAVLKDREADKQPVVSRATPSEIQVGRLLCCARLG